MTRLLNHSAVKREFRNRDLVLRKSELERLEAEIERLLFKIGSEAKFYKRNVIYASDIQNGIRTA